MTFKLNYDEMIMLDAEDLAEGSIGEAYRDRVVPKLRRFVPEPAPIEETGAYFGGDEDRYVVRYRDQEFVVWSPDIDNSEGQSWGRAAHTLFAIVNDQLRDSTHRFYAINGGNDLNGMFLTPAEAELARKVVTGKEDWPYLPELQHPWYGQHHD